MGKPEDYHGHKTMLDGSHVPLTADEVKAIWDAVEAAKAKRIADMPTARDALQALIRADERLRDLGWWKGGGLRLKRGDECAVAEFGSSGIFRGWIDQGGEYVHYADCVSDPRKCWLKPLADLTDDERAHMEECDRREAQAHEAEMARCASMAEGDEPK